MPPIFRFSAVTLLTAAMACAAGCVHYQTTLVNDQGQTHVCKGGGWIGPVSQLAARKRYKECVDQAKASGFKESKTS